jgi:hypothetical protein
VNPERKPIRTLGTLRRKRNAGAYDDYGLVSQDEAGFAGKLAVASRPKTGLGSTIRTRSLKSRGTPFKVSGENSKFFAT